ncbi:hypothetical protein B0T22DRAFT_72179 [Podospora appendiculata]|uniref:RING-type domain-containing protein n=1 Tax=Podospora appendiculata TaxID=314037 RepID=A0AAE0XJM3_9PEZI|nr:hypothetical protein B0T22DRAFT_72179 [Podospora appendiculata]
MPTAADTSRDPPSGGSPATSAVLCITVVIVIGIVVCLARRNPALMVISENIQGRVRGAITSLGIGDETLKTMPVLKYTRTLNLSPGSHQDIALHTTEEDTTWRRGPRAMMHAMYMYPMIKRPRTRAARSWFFPGRHQQANFSRSKRSSPSAQEQGLAPAMRSCAICTEDFVYGTDVRKLPCDHLFHRSCIDPWLLDFAVTCPLCRIDIKSLAEGQTVTEPPRAATVDRGSG